MKATVEIEFNELLSVHQFLDAYFGMVLGLELELHEGEMHEMPYQFSVHDWPMRWSPIKDANLLYELIEKHKITVKWSEPAQMWFAKDPTEMYTCADRSRAQAETTCLAMILNNGTGKVKIPKKVYDGLTKKD